jgi:hypothetical protein
MDPITGLGATAKAVRGRLAFYVGVQIASVLAPGVVVIAESWFVVTRVEHSKVSTQLRETSGPYGLLLLLVVLSGGYVIGYVSRELAFKGVGQVERIPRFRTRLNMEPGRRLGIHATDSLIQECMDVHPYLGDLRSATGTDGGQSPADRVSARTGGGSHADDHQFANFNYAKAWLRRHAPESGLDSMEAEINILASTLVPTLLAAAAIVPALHFHWWAYLLAPILFIFTSALILDSLLRLRRSERFEAIRNLLMDHAMRRAAARYSTESRSRQDAGE